MHPSELQQLRKSRGEGLKQARKKKGISLSELSHITGIHRTTLGEIEAARTSWRIDTEIIIMEALGISKIDGFIEIDQEGNKITSLKITGVSLRIPPAQA